MPELDRDDDALLARYLDGRRLPPEAEARLRDMLGDPATAERIKELVLIDGLLARLLAPECVDFRNRVRSRLERAGGTARFVRRVGAAAARRRRPGSRTITRWSAAALVALAAGLLLLVTLRDPGVGIIESGEGRLWRAGREQAVESGVALAAGDRLEATAALALRLADGSRLALSAGGDLVVEPQAGVTATLARGRLDAQVAKRTPASVWRLRTPDADVVVLGTRFTCALDTEGTRVAVSKGSVRLEHPQSGALQLASGEEAVAARGGALRRVTAPVTIGGGGGGGTGGEADSIAVNLGAPAMDAGESAGVVSATHWTTITDIASVALVDGNGTATTASHAFSSSNWGGGVNTDISDAAGDARMLRGWLDQTAGLTHSVSAIPFARYDLYLYFDRLNDNIGSFVHKFTITDGAGAVLAGPFYAKDAAVTAFAGWVEVPTTSISDQQAGTPAGNYLRIRGLTTGSLRILAGAGDESWGQNGFSRSALGGFQIVRAEASPPSPAN